MEQFAEVYVCATERLCLRGTYTHLECVTLLDLLEHVVCRFRLQSKKPEPNLRRRLSLTHFVPTNETAQNAREAAVHSTKRNVTSSLLCGALFHSTVLLVVLQSALSGALNGAGFYAVGFFPGSPYMTLAILCVAEIVALYLLVYVIEYCGSARKACVLLTFVGVVIYGVLAGLLVADDLQIAHVLPRFAVNYLYIVLAVLATCAGIMGSSAAYIYM